MQTWGRGEGICSGGSRAASSEHGRKTMPFSCRNLDTYPPFNSEQRRSSMEIRAQQIDWSAAVSGEPHEAAAAAEFTRGKVLQNGGFWRTENRKRSERCTCNFSCIREVGCDSFQVELINRGYLRITQQTAFTSQKFVEMPTDCGGCLLHIHICRTQIVLYYTLMILEALLGCAVV